MSVVYSYISRGNPPASAPSTSRHREKTQSPDRTFSGDTGSPSLSFLLSCLLARLLARGLGTCFPPPASCLSVLPPFWGRIPHSPPLSRKRRSSRLSLSTSLSFLFLLCWGLRPSFSLFLSVGLSHITLGVDLPLQTNISPDEGVHNLTSKSHKDGRYPICLYRHVTEI